MVNDGGKSLLELQEVIFVEYFLVGVNFFGLTVEWDKKVVKLFGSFLFELDNVSQDDFTIVKLPLWFEFIN
jgi:hypothetical protein